MSYFLKKTMKKKGVYLQIYEGKYDPSIGNTVQRSYRALGYVDDLLKEGIKDPVTYFKAEIDELNAKEKFKRAADKTKQISENTPERHLGYFPLKSINDGLNVKGYLDLMQSPFGFKYNINDVLSSLCYARVVDPCSKYKTYHDVLPLLYDQYNYSEDQMYDALTYIGSEYEKIIEIYNHQINEKYHFNFSKTYFDCTNFYFEIDKEDELRRKGPEKNKRHDPIVGMGLLLDANQIPVGMKIFPGNESEKPKLREIISDMKSHHHIKGRTIRVADKGLNCAENIVHALRDKDGYIFSKSVKQMAEKEQKWVLSPNDYEDVYDKDGKLLYRIKECVDDFPSMIEVEGGKKKEVLLREKRIVTFNPDLATKKILEINRQVDKALKLRLSEAKKKEYGHSSKYFNFTSVGKDGKDTGKKVAVGTNKEAIEKDMLLAGYNCIVTSEVKMSPQKIYDVYHNLWRIEESFRVMKSYLNARPVFVRTPDSIAGHFLICYLSILLMRLFQFNVLEDQVSSETIIGFMRNFHIVKISSN